MRKILYSVFAAALVLAGCQKETEKDAAVRGGQTLSFVAEHSVDSKSSMTIDGSTVRYSWTKDDIDFHVFYGDTETDTRVTSYLDGQKMSLTAHFADNVLPTSGNVNFTGYLNGSIKSIQLMDAANGSYDPTADVMIAKASVPASKLNEPILFQFRRMVSIAKFTLNDLPGTPTSVTVSADQPILGSWDQNGNYTAAEGDITVNGMDSNVVYVVCAPNENVTFTLTANGNDWTYSGTAADKKLTAGNVRGMKVAMKDSRIEYVALFGADYNSDKVGSYEKEWSSTNDGFTVDLANFNNNNNLWDYIKVGTKNGYSVGTITTRDAIPEAINKVTVTIDAIMADSVNSIKLYSGDSADNCTDEEGSFELATGEQTVSIAAPATDRFYMISFDCEKGSKNGLVQVSKVVYSGFID